MKDQQPVLVQKIAAPWLKQRQTDVDVVRLDALHPVVSGNKWFKLQPYLNDAINKGFSEIVTFGGAFSNHIVACAFACKDLGLQCTGIIRGEEPKLWSHTLLRASEYGMKLCFVSREQYRDKALMAQGYSHAYLIGEGGYGTLGAEGAAGILEKVADAGNYTHIVCATGTGTTLAGLVQGALPHQSVVGISVLKNHTSIREEVEALLFKNDLTKRWVVLHDYHFGGYAKYNPLLLRFMNETWQQHALPTDFVYTAKAWFALQQEMENRGNYCKRQPGLVCTYGWVAGQSFPASRCIGFLIRCGRLYLFFEEKPMKVFVKVSLFIVISIVLGSLSRLHAQEMKAALPQYELNIIGKDRVRISWVNPYGEELIQINVQRSYDSLRGYKTVFSTPSPELPENGFIEPFYPGVKVYYRIFYMLSSNAYFFTPVKRASATLLDDSVAKQLAATNDTVTVKTTESVIARLPYSEFLKFKDSLFAQTKDTLLLLSNDTVLLKPYIYNGAWRASVYLFTDRLGVVNLKLPQAKEKSYSLHVYEADSKTKVFFLKHITETELMIDKANFLHAGWFNFELYEDDKLKERNKIFIQKAF